MSAIYPCYPACNWAMLNLERSGLSPASCADQGLFLYDFSSCIACLQSRGGTSNSTYAFVESYIQQYYQPVVEFCNAVTPVSEAASSSGTPQSSTSGGLQLDLIPRTPAAIAPGSGISLSSTAAAIPSSTKSQITTTSSEGPFAIPTPSSTYAYGFWLQYTFILCPTRSANTEGTITPQDTGPNAIWGCSPGFVCSPPQVDCDVESGPPPFDYLCDAKYCIPAPSIPQVPTVNVNGTSTVFSPFPLPTRYFNLNPAIFGADWGIFTGNVSVPSTSSSASPSSNATITRSQATSATQTPTSSPTPTPTPTPKPHSAAWIAGPIVGSLAIASLLLAILYIRHRNRRKIQPVSPPETHEKAQLDGEGIKPKELHNNEIGELEANRIEPAEMDAGFTPAEMGAAKARIKRKPVQRATD